MATPAQIAANRANSQKSTGPNTLEGRGRAAMNALIHGMRSAIEAERDQESEKYQRRFSHWMAEFDPPTDSLEYQLSKTLNLAMELDRGENYSLMKRSDWLDEFDANLAEEARVLINRLFFDPNGPTALYGERGFRTKPGKPSASFSGKADDPNEPAKILIELEKTEFGCQLLLDEWTYLKSKLESRWESPDRFRAIRLLGAQPIDAKEQRHVAEIFLASHVKTGDNTNPFQDLKDEMLPSKAENLEEQVYGKWPDIVRKNQKAAGRQLLSRLVEENMKRLVAKLEAFCPEACGKKVFKKQSFDDSPEGKRLKIQVQKLDASVNRRLSKIRKECRGDQDSASRRAWRDAGKEPKRVEGGGWRVAGADEYSARRAQEDGTTLGAAPAENGTDPERGGSMVDRVLEHGFAGAEEVSPSVSVSANSSSDPHPDPLPEGEGEVWCSRSPLLSRPRLSPPDSKTRSEQSDRISDRAEVESSAEGQVADEENTATWDAGSEAGDLGVKPASDTNEANFHGDVIKSQTAENLGVMAELAIGAGLDNDGGMQVVSPDLVCPDSELESSEAVGSDADELEARAVGLSEGAGAEVVESGARGGPLAESRAVAGTGVDVGPVPGAEDRELRAEKEKSRGGGARLSQMTEREKVQAMRERQRKNLERVLDAQKKLLRDWVSSSPEMGEMMRQQLPREP